MNVITFHNLNISDSNHEIDIQLVDVVATFLYGSLDVDIYKKVYDEIDIQSQHVFYMI